MEELGALFTQPGTWAVLITLIAMEVVLGVEGDQGNPPQHRPEPQ